jgi:putative aldouronate transport system permease protein
VELFLMKIKKTVGEQVFQIFNYVFLGLMTLTFILPFWTTVISSFVGEQERINRGMLILWPRVFDFSAYQTILRKGSNVYMGFAVTLTRTMVGTAASMLVTAMLALGLAKRDLPFRTPISFLIYFTMLFSGGLIPTFLVVKYTGLYDTIGAFIVPSLVSVWNLLLLRNFFMEIPESLEEAAFIDGATPAKYLSRIVIPLSLPSIATISLFYAVWHWNSWFDALIYISNQKLLPLQMILRNVIIASSVENILESGTTMPPPLETVKGATIVVSTQPILFVYPYIQRYFVKGIMVGGVKG